MATFGGETVTNTGNITWNNTNSTYTVPAGRYAKIVINGLNNVFAGTGSQASVTMGGLELLNSGTTIAIYSLYMASEFVLTAGQAVSMAQGSSGHSVTINFSYREFVNP